MAFKSRVETGELDTRFYYEPMLTAHPKPGSLQPFPFLGKMLRTPVWVSSMTGGTALANKINRQLARACGEFGMGMGLGSCRQLLYSNEFLPDFDVRDEIGTDLPLYANLGIAQVEKLLQQIVFQICCTGFALTGFLSTSILCRNRCSQREICSGVRRWK